MVVHYRYATVILSDLLQDPEDPFRSSLKNFGRASQIHSDDREAKLALVTARYALVVVNMVLPHGSCLDLLVWLRRINRVVPVFTFRESSGFLRAN